MEFKVKLRDEIVSLGRTDIVPKQRQKRHLSPEDWHRAMTEEDVVVLDTRNDYEFQMGHFSGAINPAIREFNEFPEYLRQAAIDKDKKVLIYCTGGIRCEKAIYEMENQGFTNVYQLDGGILNYIEKFPSQKFLDECFVFDYRVAVDQELKPSTKTKLCPHCGLPTREVITCGQCGTQATVCSSCQNKEQALHTCSKNCAYHYRRTHTTPQAEKQD